MRQKTLAKWLKFIIIGVGLCGLSVYAWFIPAYGLSLVSQYPEFSNRFWPWLLFLLATAVPCYIALVFAWRIAVNISADRSFSMENARLLQWISWLAAGDSVYFFVGNFVLLLLNMSHPGIVLYSLPVVFVGIAVTVTAAALSHLVRRAAELQEQSDLTI